MACRQATRETDKLLATMAAAAMSLQCATTPVAKSSIKDSALCRRSQSQALGYRNAAALRGRALQAVPLVSTASRAGVVLKGAPNSARRDCVCMAYEAAVGIYGRKEGMTQVSKVVCVYV